MNTERTIATIRRVLIGNPAADVKFVDAIAADSHFVSTNGRVLVLFVNPEHGELIDELRPVPICNRPPTAHHMPERRNTSRAWA